MTQDEVIIRSGIVHILDGELGYPVFSEEPLELSPDINDFFRGLIYKLLSGDDLKKCSFDQVMAEAPGEEDAPFEEDQVTQPDGPSVYDLVKSFREEDLVEHSKILTQKLYDIMNANVDIPSGDFAVVTFQLHSTPYLALLKMNYKESFVHMTQPSESGANVNHIIRYRATLPSATTRLSEAVIINLSDYQVQIVEKKYDVNGSKVNYLSELYLHCHAAMSSKTKLDIVTKAVEQVNKKYYEEQPVKQMEAKRVIQEEIASTGSIHVEDIGEKLFGDIPEVKEAFDQKMEKYHMEKAEVRPQSEKTTQKFEKQYIKTDTGIEIRIPMEQYEDVNQVEFITNPDGTISVLIKNINHLTTR